MNQLLTEIDGVGVKKNVFFIGATNRPNPDWQFPIFQGDTAEMRR